MLSKDLLLLCNLEDRRENGLINMDPHIQGQTGKGVREQFPDPSPKEAADYPTCLNMT